MVDAEQPQVFLDVVPVFSAIQSNSVSFSYIHMFFSKKNKRPKRMENKRKILSPEVHTEQPEVFLDAVQVFSAIQSSSV